MIPIFQNHIFEKKLQKKVEAKHLNNRFERTPSKPVETVIKSLQQLDIRKCTDDEGVLTPNRTNFNLNEASPFLININCRRPKYKAYDMIKSQCKDNDTVPPINADAEVIEISDSDDENDTKTQKLVKNLFELTEENIEKHLSMVVKKNRKDSLICLWRNKVNESRLRKSMLPINEIEFDAFLSEHTEDVESPSVESSKKSADTVVPVKPKLEKDTETEDSFLTADDQNGKKDHSPEIKIVESETKKEETGIIFQTQEVYQHVDVQNNIVFYENRLQVANLETNPKQEIINLNTSSESGTCTDVIVPTDYDTDDLRKELKSFGDQPGPITKNTKRLYLKRLIRYKRRPQHSVKNQRDKCSKYSESIEVELNVEIILFT